MSSSLVHKLEEKMPYSIALFIGAFLPNFVAGFCACGSIVLLLFGASIHMMLQLSVISGIGCGFIGLYMDQFIMK